MYPSIFHWGPITLHSYGLMIALGFITILYFMQRDARRVGVDPNAIGDTAFWTLILGVASTRLTHIIMFPQFYSWTDPIGWINVTNGGLVFQGAIPTAMAYIYWSMRRRNISFLVVADIVLPYVPIAQAFGRMGCFLKGCCHGARADDLPWAVCFPEGSPAFSTHQHVYANFPADATWSYPVHPTQLYSIVLLLCITALLLYFRKHRSFIGMCLPLYFVFYAIKRFIVEMYRGDGNPTHQYFGLDLTTQQWFCVGMMVFGLATWFLMYRFRDRTADTTFPTPPESGAA